MVFSAGVAVARRSVLNHVLCFLQWWRCEDIFESEYESLILQGMDHQDSHRLAMSIVRHGAWVLVTGYYIPAINLFASLRSPPLVPSIILFYDNCTQCLRLAFL